MSSTRQRESKVGFLGHARSYASGDGEKPNAVTRRRNEDGSMAEQQPTVEIPPPLAPNDPLYRDPLVLIDLTDSPARESPADRGARRRSRDGAHRWRLRRSVIRFASRIWRSPRVRLRRRSRPEDRLFRPWLPTRALMWLPGADPELTCTRAEAYRWAALGQSMLLVGFLAGLSFVLYAQTILGGYRPWIAYAGAGWGLIILSVDRLILVDPHYGRIESEDEQAPWLGRWAPHAAVGLLRVSVAVITAVLISESLLLVVFRPEIERTVHDSRQAIFDTQIAAVADRAAAASQMQLDKVLEDRTAAVAQRDARAKEFADADAQYYAEINNRRWPGYGTMAKRADAERDKDRRALERAKTKVDQLDARITTLQQAVAGYRDPHSNQYLVLRDGPVGEPARTLRDAPIGWLERERGLAEFQRANRRDTSVQLLPWLLRALLLIIDLIPLATKMLNSKTLYGRRLREQAREVRTADHEMSRLRLDRIRRAIALEDAREERYLAHRLDHLHRPAAPAALDGSQR